MISKLASDVYNTVRSVFPQEIIIPEHYVYYRRTKLFFDFYLKGLNIFIECQGEQHFKFVKHFHGDAEAFSEHKRRDRLKLEYSHESGIPIVFFNSNEPITEERVRLLLFEAHNDSNN